MSGQVSINPIIFVWDSIEVSECAKFDKNVDTLGNCITGRERSTWTGEEDK